MSGKPYTRKHKDPWDNKIDTVGNGMQPSPFRNGDGATILGPRNLDRERQDPDMVRPPSTDHGTMKNMKWSFADSHMRIEEGGCARQTTIRELPTSVELAGVNMRLNEGAIRELHWHKEAEWAYVLEGKVRITPLDPEGGMYIDDLEKGLAPGGTEFLLIFDDGNFSEDSTFLLTDWLAHAPKSVITQNFRLKPELFAHIPGKEKYIFEGAVPGSIEKEMPSGRGINKSKLRFTHKMLAQKPFKASGGEVRIADTSNFPLSTTVAASHVIINPGAMREMHWHPNADEWSYFIKGRARVTVFASSNTARTFDYVAGDVGIVPKNMGHYVQNLSDTEPVEMLEIFRAAKFLDFSLQQWLGETPPRMVAEHLFMHNKEAGEKFLEEIKGAKKDVVKPKL